MYDPLIEIIINEYFGNVPSEAIRTHCSLKYIKDAMVQLLKLEREEKEIQ